VTLKTLTTRTTKLRREKGRRGGKQSGILPSWRLLGRRKTGFPIMGVGHHGWQEKRLRKRVKGEEELISWNWEQKKNRSINATSHKSFAKQLETKASQLWGEGARGKKGQKRCHRRGKDSTSKNRTPIGTTKVFSLRRKKNVVSGLRLTNDTFELPIKKKKNLEGGPKPRRTPLSSTRSKVWGKGAALRVSVG